MPHKVLNRAFLNQKRGSEGHIPLKLCLRGCVFLGILSTWDMCQEIGRVR